jgi:FkbM family methyltransferase
MLLAKNPTHAHSRFAVLPGDAVSEEIMVAGLYEEALLLMLFEHVFKGRHGEFAGAVVLDVGANIGNHALFMARYFSRVLAFEPNPMALSVLRCNVALAAKQNVDVFALGLGDQSGTMTFIQNDEGNLGGSGFEFAGVERGTSIKCEIARGDDVLTREVLGAPLRVIKIDIEGAELAALRGLRETIVREQPFVLFESNRALGSGGGNEVFAFLRNLGYSRFFAIEEVTVGRGRLSRLFTRMILGERMRVVTIEAPKNPPYSLIVAVPGAEQLPC